ncbi:uncharacterized protein LOC128217941 isoform X2 [Mya arenaria]|uniref:uncharacterized protein LOC128217941 isoform X2 n=1 Tax=Mya arenaria TaxID=6604 RepID=UPI0022E0A577|nr:uncharacterized protein LOC128217941 isoform X2 [Mya arenaria]
MIFKLCTITVFMGICLLVSNGKSPNSAKSGDRKFCTLKSLETQNTDGRSSELLIDCTDNDTVCQRYCRKYDKESSVALYCTTHDSGWSPAPKPTPTDEVTPSKQKKAYDCPVQVCPRKDCETLREISGVSVGAAVGILVLGLFVGAMATAALCVCCPSAHAKASAVRSGKKKTCRGNLEDEEISNANEQKSRHLPVAPLPSLPADIRSRATTAQNANGGRADSQHIYSESMDLPVDDHSNTKSSLAPVTSPRYGYKKFVNDVTPGTSSSTVAESAYQPLNTDRGHSAEYNQISAVRDDGDLRSQEHSDPGGAHHDFVLKKKDAEMDCTETGHPDNDTSVPHDSFVLEKK